MLIAEHSTGQTVVELVRLAPAPLSGRGAVSTAIRLLHTSEVLFLANSWVNFGSGMLTQHSMDTSYTVTYTGTGASVHPCS